MAATMTRGWVITRQGLLVAVAVGYGEKADGLSYTNNSRAVESFQILVI